MLSLGEKGGEEGRGDTILNPILIKSHTPTHLVVLEEGPELLQTVQVPYTTVFQCLLLKVSEQIPSEPHLQPIAVEPEETLETIAGVEEEEEWEEEEGKRRAMITVGQMVVDFTHNSPIPSLSILQCKSPKLLVHLPVQQTISHTQLTNRSLMLDTHIQYQQNELEARLCTPL